jgi:hypothetical protein
MDTRSLVEELLSVAVTAAYSSERVLFRERAHERSIVFHIARRLADEVDERMPGWFADVEYDRWHPDDLQGAKKRMLLARFESAPAHARSQVGAEGADDEERTSTRTSLCTSDPVCLPTMTCSWWR